MKTYSFENAKTALREACEALRPFTLGQRGFTERHGVLGIRRVNSRCNRMERLFVDAPGLMEIRSLIASARSRVVAAEARLSVLRKGIEGVGNVPCAKKRANW